MASAKSIFFLCFFAFVLAGCVLGKNSPPTPAPGAPEHVTLTDPDGRYLSSMERELANHRNGQCAALAREENQVIKEGLAILRKRVIQEAERDGEDLPPLGTRIDRVFNAILTEEGWSEEV
ncbi:hypothetical protein SELMODRAFT_406935 [Selaginella moellendorffii]|uniref:Lipoprotein n=1 Tax=Selaginella moellendorffii TaxID=88036 RepID=D8R3E4_SELML|nr:hypothetical protein SELMODRAFT_406935 [Selaginella moellendorffii]